MVPSLPPTVGERGAKAGEFRIWPRLTLEAGFDSNVFYAAEDDTYQKVGSPFMLLSPGIRLENPDGRDIILSFDGSGAFRRFFSGDETIDGPQSNFGADATLGLQFFPRRAASLEIYDSVTHRLETPNFSTTKTFNRVVNTAGTKVKIHPGGVGGRRALELSLGYAFQLEKFLDFDVLDQYEHTFSFLGTWKFFPKTALFTDATFSLREWDKQEETLGRTNSTPLRAYVGLTGFISKKVSTTIKLGYGAGMYAVGQDFSGVLGEATISYIPVRSTVLSFGYSRDFRDSLYANFYGHDRLNLRAMQQFLGRFNIKTELAYSLIDYSYYDPALGGPVIGDVFKVVNTPDRQDSALDVLTSLDFEVTRYFAFQLSYSFREVYSDFEERSSTDGVLSVDDEIIDVGGYDRHMVLVVCVSNTEGAHA
jgi:hypothetical protein